jgi:hypothetical protein
MVTSQPSQRGRHGYRELFATDALGVAGHSAPHPLIVLVSSAFLGATLLMLFRFGARLGLRMPMFAKEGFAENLTFLLDLWAAVLCGLAAWRTAARRDTEQKLIVTGYAFCALLLFLVAMDEIGWGQQLVGYQTPAAWRALNYQQETTLHNLVDREMLTFAWKIVAAAFALGVVALVTAAELTRWQTLQYLAPHPALVPLAMLTGLAGVAVHPEMAELLISIFFAFYGYRIYVISGRVRAYAP